MFSLALNFDSAGPQSGLWGNRFNPIHTMTATGTDAVAGRQESIRIRYADDMVTMPLQCGTQWDALGHIFYGEKMWNGYDLCSWSTRTGRKKTASKKRKTKWSAGACFWTWRVTRVLIRSMTAMASTG